MATIARRASPAPSPVTRAPRSWSRPSTRTRCTRCAPRWRRTPPRPGCRRAAPTIWSSPCTNWPPTPSGTAPGTAGYGSGNRITPCSARSATTASRRQRTTASQARRTPRNGASSPATACRWSARSPTRPACARARPAPWPPSASPWARRDRRSAWTSGTWTAARSWPSPARSTSARPPSSRPRSPACSRRPPANRRPQANRRPRRRRTPQPPGLRLILDLSGLAGWDSSGLAALITAQQRISASPPARMVLAGLPAHLAKHLHEAGLADRFTLADTPAVAVTTFP